MILKYTSTTFFYISSLLAITCSLNAQTHLIVDRSSIYDIPAASIMSAAESYKVNGTTPDGIYSSSEPHITVFANPSDLTLQTVELLLYSIDDCIPFCSSAPNTDPRSAYFGTYVFEHYSMDSLGNKNLLTEPIEFEIDQDYIDELPGVLIYENPNDETKPVLRRLILNISGAGIKPPSDSSSYISIKYIASPDINPFQPGLERTVSILYSKFNGELEGTESTIPSQSDYISHTRDSGGVQLNRVSNIRPLTLNTKSITSNMYYRFAAKYSLGTDVHYISDCGELRELNGEKHTSIEITEDIVCDPDAPFTPIQIETPFTLNGENHTISGISIESDQDDVGIFSRLPKGTSIGNLRLENITIRGNNNVGSLAGVAEQNTTVYSMDITNAVIEGNHNIGGLIGVVRSGSFIEGVFLSADIEGIGMIGSAAGVLSSSTVTNLTISTSLKGSYNTGEVCGGCNRTTISRLNPLVSIDVLPSEVPIQGDCDQNGIVEQADYNIWRNQFGLSVSPAGYGGDANRDGIVSISDYVVWRNNLGKTR